VIDHRSPKEIIEHTKKSIKKIVKINQIAKEQEVDAINILIFGRRGAGKSSFIQSLLWALTGEKSKREYHVASQPHVVTQELLQYQMEACGKHVTFWDMFGIEGPNYEEVLPFMMRGQVLTGVKNGVRPSKILPESLGRSIHSIIFLLDPTTLNEEREISRVKRTIEPLIKAKIPIIPVLTKLDGYLGYDNSASFGDIVKDLRTEAVIQDFYLAMDEVFAIEEIEVFVNYSGEDFEFDPQRDLKVIHIAKRAIEGGTNYVNTREKKISVSNIPLYLNSFSNYVGLIEDPLGEVDKMSIVRTILEENYPSLVGFIFVNKKGEKIAKSNEANMQLGYVLNEYDKMPALMIRVDEPPYSDGQIVVRCLTNFRKLPPIPIQYEESLLSVRSKIEESGVKFYSFLKMIDKKYFPVGLVVEQKSSIMNIAIENGNGYDVIIKL
jgi:GTPase SAR1 family protein